MPDTLTVPRPAPVTEEEPALYVVRLGPRRPHRGVARRRQRPRPARDRRCGS